jgi:hypothetical protein
MAKITITKDNLPTSEQFKEMLELMEAHTTPFESILSLMRQLVAFEQQYGLSSDVFYARFMRGEVEDTVPFIRWAGRYELYLEAKHLLENQAQELAIVA